MIMAVGQFLIGVVNPFLLVPSLPEMIESALIRFPDQESQVNDLSSGIFNSFLGLGQISGPIYGSLVTSSVGFRLCTDYVAFACLAFAFVYFVFGQGLDAFTKKRIIDREEDLSLESTILVTALNRSALISNEIMRYRSFS